MRHPSAAGLKGLLTSRSTAAAPAPAPPAPAGARPLRERAGKASAVGRARVLRSPAALIAGVVLIVLLAEWAFMRPLLPSDQVIYFNAAASWPDVVPEHWQLRIGLVLPVRGLIELFGYTQLAYYAIPFASTAALAGATAYLGNRLFGRAVGIAAGVLCVFNTYVLVEATTLLPDIPATALFTIAVGLLVRTGEKRQGDAWVRRDTLVLVGVGLLLGWSYLIREFIVFVFPAVGLLLWHYRVPLRGWLALAGAAFGVFLTEVAINAAVYGDPFVRVAVAAGHGNQPLDPGVAASFQNKSTATVLGRLPEALDASPDVFWSLPLLVALLVGAIFTRRRPLLFLAAWFACMWISLTLLGGILDPASPSLRIQKIRYWYPVFPALYIGGLATLSITLGWLAKRRGGGRFLRWLRVAAIAGVAIFAVAVAGSNNLSKTDAYRITGANHLGALDSWLHGAGRDVSTIWTDSHSSNLIRIATQRTFGDSWSGEIRVLTPDALPISPSPPGAGRTAVVQYGADAGGNPCGFCRQSFARVLGKPAQIPSDWRSVAETPDGWLRVYIVK